MKKLALLFCFTACLPSSKYGNLANQASLKNDVDISAPIESDDVNGNVADIPNSEIGASSSSVTDASTHKSTNTSTSDSSPTIGTQNACLIDLPSCPEAGHPRFVLDTYEDSANNPNRCLRRAAEFKAACKTTDEVIAKSYLGGVLVGSATTSPSAGAGNACVMDIPSCPAAGHPRFMLDTYEDSANNPERCLRRASEFKAACQTPHEVTAKSYLSYAFVGSATTSPSAGAGNACVIDVPSCPAVAGYPRFIFDTYEDATNNPDRCLRRAAEFKAACKTPHEVTAKSFLNYAFVGSATTTPSVADGNACVIDVPSCPAHPGYPRFIFDTYDNAGNNPERCLRRASEFKTACKTPHEVVAKSYLGWVLAGVSGTSPHIGAGNACVIDIPSCPAVGHPRFVFDTYENSPNDPDRCLRRASEYKRHCQTPHEVVAKSYLGGVLVGAAGTSPHIGAGNACVIDIPSCPAVGHPRFVFDTYENSPNDPERCLRRASEYKSACQTPHEVVSKSYLGGVLVGVGGTSPYIGAGNACVIDIPSCPAVGHQRFVFDTYENSPNDPNRCLRRASEYKHACQSPEPVRALSYLSGTLQGAKTAYDRASYDRGAFNEMFVMSHLMSLGAGFSSFCNDASQCPTNMGPIPVGKIDQILGRLRKSGRIDSIRDIIPLMVAAPDPYHFPFDAEIASVLKVYQKNNIELLLTFGLPVPGWIYERARARGWQDTDAAVMDEIANAMAYFITRMKEQQGVDAHWFATRVVVEPFNEINSIARNPYYHQLLDNLVREKLRGFHMGVRETVPSSITIGNTEHNLYWFREYYARGGSGPANVHFYAEDLLDQGNYSNSLQRFETNIEGLRSLSAGGRVIIGEIGFPSAGVGKHNSQQTHDEIFYRTLHSPTFQKSEKIYYWRLLSNWLNVRCDDNNCSPIVARETTFGYMDFHSLQPEGVLSYFFLPFGF